MPRFTKKTTPRRRINGTASAKYVGTPATTPATTPTKTPTPTQEQSNIYEHVSRISIVDGCVSFSAADLKSCTIINAVAGSGKTHTSINSLAHLNPDLLQRTRYVSFAKANAEDAAAKMSDFGIVSGIASTHHKLGKTLYENWARANGKPAPRIEKDKVKKHLASSMDRRTLQDIGWSGTRAIERLVSVAKSHYLFSDFKSDRNLMLDLADAYEIDLVSDNPRFQIDSMLSASFDALFSTLKDTSCMDFDDMIAQPVYLDMTDRNLDVLYVDEAQDSNPVQTELDFRIARHLILVGDDNQSIYAFRGAGSGGLKEMDSRAMNEGAYVANLPLTINWRCGKEIIRYASHLVPEIQAAPSSIDGTVLFNQQRTTIITTLKERAGETCAVLARRNAGLFPYFFSLLRSGIPSYKAGGSDNMIQSIRALIRKCSGAGSMSSFSLLVRNELDLRLKTKLAELSRQGRSNKYTIARAQQRIEELHECMNVLAANCTTSRDMEAALDRLCPRTPEPGAVCLSTIHKSKGQEYDNVIITDLEYFGKSREVDELLEDDSAENDSEGNQFRVDWEQQELNLAYVATTRAKKTLTFDGPKPEVFSV